MNIDSFAVQNSLIILPARVSCETFEVTSYLAESQGKD